MRGTFRVAELAAALGGIVVGDPERLITGVSTLIDARPSEVSFVESTKYVRQLEKSAAGAVIVPEGLTPPERMSGISVANPAVGMAQAIDLFFPPERAITSVSPLAVLGARVSLGADVGIGPYVVVGNDVSIGSRSEIHPTVTVGAGASIGEDCVLHAGVHVYPNTVLGNRVILHSGAVIGADGFGYVQEPGLAAPVGTMSSEEPMRHRKIRQVGRVVLEDDVEVGANSAIDRAAYTETRVGRGTKIDNLVTIGHNSRVGRHCIIIGQAGISGSAVLGDYVTIAGQAGLAGHLTIGSHAVIGAQAGVTKSVPPGGVVLGSPAVDVRRARKALALFDRLPEFKKQIAAHEGRLRAVEARLTSKHDDAIRSD